MCRPPELRAEKSFAEHQEECNEESEQRGDHQRYNRSSTDQGDQHISCDRTELCAQQGPVTSKERADRGDQLIERLAKALFARLGLSH